jgi:hypothetical protein
MEETNKTNMGAMMEQMNALVRHAHQPDKVNTPPGSNVIPLVVAPKPRNPGGRKPSVPTANVL